MIKRQRGFLLGSICLASFLLGVSFPMGARAQTPATVMDQMLFDDGFEKLRPGPLMPVVGPHSEYHFLPEAIPEGRG